jgi:hypothetical protein
MRNFYQLIQNFEISQIYVEILSQNIKQSNKNHQFIGYQKMSLKFQQNFEIYKFAIRNDW